TAMSLVAAPPPHSRLPPLLQGPASRAGLCRSAGRRERGVSNRDVARRHLTVPFAAAAAPTGSRKPRRFMQERTAPSAGERRDPAQAFAGAGCGLVFAADPAVVAELVDEAEQPGVVDLARPRLVAARGVGDLRVGDPGQVPGDGVGELALHALHVIDV